MFRVYVVSIKGKDITMDNEILKHLFLNRLNIENNLKEYVKNKMYPFTNMEDYIKYGDMFIQLNVNSDANKNS